MERIDQEHVKDRDQSRKVLAIFLIVIGFLWIARQSGIFYGFPFFHINHIFAPVGRIFGSMGHLIFSWPMILILVGVVLMAGKRSAGLVLLVIGGIFLLPKLFLFSGAVILFFPLVLIAVGIAIVARIL
ncbi:MAG TPA: hypothetical protein PK335_15125 [Draconibacterium sp.]|nr:hypothetical protein [Draconibacterium sp.]